MDRDRERQSAAGEPPPRPAAAGSPRQHGRLREALFWRAEMWIMGRDGLPPRVELPPGVTCAPADTAMLLRLGDGTEQVVRTRLERGDRAMIALLEGEPAAVWWISAGPQLIWDIRSEVVPAPNQALIYGGYTVPAHRRRGLATVLEQSLAEDLAGKGITSAIRVVVAGNEAGLGQARRSGYRPLLRIQYRRFLGIGIHIVRRADRGARWRLSLAGASRPLRLAVSGSNP